jgi:hypothetical protein
LIINILSRTQGTGQEGAVRLYKPRAYKGVEGCFNLKPPHGEDQPLPPTSSKCKTVINGLEKANKFSVVYHKKQIMKRFKCPKYNVVLRVDLGKI